MGCARHTAGTFSPAGGYGDPFTRDPQPVLDDVLDEKITVGYAEREYGVAVDAATGCVDSERIRQLRSPE